MKGQPISVEALERPVEENRPQPNPVEGAGTGPMATAERRRRVTPRCVSCKCKKSNDSAPSMEMAIRFVYVVVA